ncbi:MAG: glycosyltransferase family 39 protein [Anaerolineaceae bacterium]|nr:MAG: glycosyltransferase family 39 protein [Anaerolineaceae bacterium]
MKITAEPGATPDEVNRGDFSTIPHWIVPSIVVILAIFLRLYQLGVPSLWLDETHSWWLTRLPWGDLAQALREIGVHPPLYFSVLKITSSFIGDNEFGLRIFSVIVDLASILVVMQIGRTVGGRPGLIAAGWFWAFQPMMIWYAREARPYALAVFFSACTVYAYLALQKHESRRYEFFAFIALSLGMLTHYFVWLVGFVLVLKALTEMRQDPRIFRRWAYIFIVTSIPIGLWLIWYFQLPSPSLGIAWISEPIIQDPVITLWNLLSGFGGATSVSTTIFGIAVVAIIAFAFLSKESRSLAISLLLIGVILPLVGIWFVSQRRPVYMDRYFSVLLPFIVVLVGVGGRKAWHRLQSSALRASKAEPTILILPMLLIIGFITGFQIHASHTYAKEDWRTLAVVLIDKEVSQQPLWLTDKEAMTALEYYLGDQYENLEYASSSHCDGSCWWILRRSYTATHAFSQAVASPGRVDEIQIPNGCRVERYWMDESSLELWNVDCE